MEKINTLYIVDDDAIFQLITSHIISSTSLVSQIKVFSNGSEAIEFIKSVQARPKELPDIIFLDLFMPVMDGWGFLEEYVSLRPFLGKKITIYIVSSSIDPGDIERAKSIDEVSDYIVKPLTEETFSKIITNLCNN